jgi:hypothetical protein
MTSPPSLYGHRGAVTLDSLASSRMPSSPGRCLPGLRGCQRQPTRDVASIRLYKHRPPALFIIERNLHQHCHSVTPPTQPAYFGGCGSLFTPNQTCSVLQTAISARPARLMVLLVVLSNVGIHIIEQFAYKGWRVLLKHDPQLAADGTITFPRLVPAGARDSRR